MVDTWTVFGTDIGFAGYAAYLKVPEAQDLIVETGILAALWETLTSLPSLFAVFRAARRMNKRWPWQDHEAYLDRPLAEIRQEFGISIIASRPSA